MYHQQYQYQQYLKTDLVMFLGKAMVPPAHSIIIT